MDRVAPVSSDEPDRNSASLPGTLRRAIALGEYPPGVKLVERELADRYGVGRTAVRDAIRHLAAERILVLTENRGARVRELNYAEAADIYQVRSVLEGLAGELFAVRGTARERVEFAASLDPIRAAHEGADLAEILITSESFYAHLLGGSGNAELHNLVEGLHVRINQIRRVSLSMPERKVPTLDALQGIVDAVVVGDAAGAKQACVDHVHASAAATLPVLAAQARGAVLQSSRN